MKAELLKSISAIEKEIAEMKKLIEASEELKSEGKVKFSFEAFKQGKIAVHCDVEEKANMLFSYMRGKGFGWNLKNNHWLLYKDKTCYRCNCGTFAHADVDYYINEGFVVIPFTLKMLEGN